ncbi:methyltransferase [Ectopseudomonas hydrolytica]|uniref:methyltransferase n=1 Tax=Ectopseudomonas hydrolytica TaxID=2493633 RepID=UPI003EDFD55E
MFSFRKQSVPQTQPLFATGLLQLSDKVHWLANKGLVDPLPYVQRHLRGDWGNVDVAGHQANSAALEQKGPITSRYQITPHLELLVHTGDDRRKTVVKLPEEQELA